GISLSVLFHDPDHTKNLTGSYRQQPQPEYRYRQPAQPDYRYREADRVRYPSPNYDPRAAGVDIDVRVRQ
ncbi:hypothetical protein, partial [Massilia varians]|uniref:hypothetical protein n=1 Tax=Massilia varians TaxID=457921 RepID=UPI0036215D6C